MTPSYWGEDLCHACGDEAAEGFDRTGWPPAWWEAPVTPYLGALGASGLLTMSGPVVCRRFANVAELGPVLEHAGVRQVWIHEAAMADLDLPASGGVSHPFLEHAGWKTRGRDPVLSGYQNFWREGGGFGFSLHIPAYEDESPFAGVDDAYRMLCYVAYYERATRGEATWMGGGSITSDRWLRNKYRSPRRADIVLTEHPEPLLTGAAREARYHWTRPPAPSEKSYRFCHSLDLNLAYAAVSSSLALPVGPCVHQDLPTFDKRLPGLWLIDPSTGGFDETALYGRSGLLPAPWQDEQWGRRVRSQAGPQWVTTPTMERCDQAGLWPLEAWLWPEHRAYLRPWYEMIRDARAELLPLGGPPLEAVKAISRRGVGRLEGRLRSKAPETDELYQPYWASAVKAECRARLHRRLAALEVAPIAIDTDAVYFLSSRSSPEALAVRVGLPLGDGLGQFKGHGSCSAADAREALEHADAIRRLRALVKEGLR